MRTLTVVFIMVVLGMALSKTAGLAATRLTEDLTALLPMAQVVAEVEITGQDVQLRAGVQVPFTIVTMDVKKVYKGEVAVNAQLQAEYIGGFDGQYLVVSPGQPKFSCGDRAVVLLSRFPGAAHWRLLGGDAGQIVLTTGADGRPLARRASNEFEYYVRDVSSPTGFTQVNSKAISRANLEELLQAILTTGRPVLAQAEAAELVSASALIADAAAAGPANAPKAPRSHALIVLFPMLIGFGVIGLFWLIVRRLR